MIMRTMRRMNLRPIIAAITLASALVIPAAARADDAPVGKVIAPTVGTKATLRVTTAPDLGSVTVALACDAVSEEVTAPDTAGTRCAGVVHVKASQQRWYWLGQWEEVGGAPLDIPLGAGDLIVPTPGLAALLESKQTLYLKATFTMPDGTEVELSTQDDAQGMLGLSQPFASEASCGIPARYSYTSTKRPVKVLNLTISGFDEQFVRTATVSDPSKLDKRFWYRTTATTTVKINGLTYALEKGAEFAMQCARSTSSKNRLTPVLYLWHGKARASGKPSGKWQVVAGIMVPPGLFSSGSRAAVDFTATSNGNVKLRPNENGLKKVFATVRSRKGILTAYQRLKIDPSAHCTPGTGVYMRMDGLTRPL